MLGSFLIGYLLYFGKNQRAVAAFLLYADFRQNPFENASHFQRAVLKIWRSGISKRCYMVFFFSAPHWAKWAYTLEPDPVAVSGRMDAPNRIVVETQGVFLNLLFICTERFLDNPSMYVVRVYCFRKKKYNKHTCRAAAYVILPCFLCR